MSRLRDFGESAATAVLERVGRSVSRVQERKPLPSDLLESDDAYLVVFDAPGTTRSDVQVRFLEGEVQVQIDRFRDYHEGYEMRFPGRGLSLDGRVALPADADVDIDAEDATATLADNGTLTVRVPKTERARTVAVGDEQSAESEGTSDADPESETEGADSEDATDVDVGINEADDTDED